MHYALDVSLYVKIKAILSCQQMEKITQHGLQYELNWNPFHDILRFGVEDDLKLIFVHLNLQLTLPLCI